MSRPKKNVEETVNVIETPITIPVKENEFEIPTSYSNEILDKTYEEIVSDNSEVITDNSEYDSSELDDAAIIQSDPILKELSETNTDNFTMEQLDDLLKRISESMKSDATSLKSVLREKGKDLSKVLMENINSDKFSQEDKDKMKDVIKILNTDVVIAYVEELFLKYNKFYNTSNYKDAKLIYLIDNLNQKFDKAMYLFTRLKFDNVYENIKKALINMNINVPEINIKLFLTNLLNFIRHEDFNIEFNKIFILTKKIERLESMETEYDKIFATQFANLINQYEV